ncbi:MAG: PQQ-binding-like beta-propeller repeat protein [Bacteroidetes bacterium]|nr:PQQ-binding-like beta-propeller repeat protein [Bacteroidota bacterium]
MRALLPIISFLLTACGSVHHMEPLLSSGPWDWPQQGGGAERHFVVPSFPSASGRTTTQATWEFSLDGTAGTAGPLLIGDVLLFPSVGGVVEAVRLSDAKTLAEFDCDWYIAGTPALLGSSLFIATIGGTSLLYCFDITSGELQWSRMFEAVHAAVCAHRHHVFVAGARGTVARFAPGDSVEIWKVQLTGPARAAPAASDTVLVVGTETGDVFGLSTETGRILWRVPTFAAVQAGPVIAGGVVIASNRKGIVHALDLHSGTVVWTYECGVPVYHSPAVRAGKLLLPVSSGDLLLLDLHDGRLLRTYTINALPGASPLLSEMHAWQLARNGNLYRVDVQSGDVHIVHKLPAGSETPPVMTPAGILLVDQDGEAIIVEVQ